MKIQMNARKSRRTKGRKNSKKQKYVKSLQNPGSRSTSKFLSLCIVIIKKTFEILKNSN